MLAANLAFQFQRQSGESASARQQARQDACEFVDLACRESSGGADPRKILENLLVTAEFFAREGRAFGGKGVAR